MKKKNTQPSRRKFLASVGLATLAATAGRGEPAAERAEVNFRIDCQSHLYPPEMLAYLEKRKEPPYLYRKDGDRYVVIGGWQRKVLPNHSDVQAKLRAVEVFDFALGGEKIAADSARFIRAQEALSR